MKKAIALTVCALSFLTSQVMAQPGKDQVLMNVCGTNVTVTEFMSVYKKNNKEQGNDPKAIDNYLDLFTIFKMKVKEAEEMKLDTASTFKTELDGYRRQLAQPYLTDKDVNEALLREAYDRMLQDVHAQHILIKCDENALPKDSQMAWNRVMIAQAMVNGKPVTKMIDEFDKQLKADLTANGTKKMTKADSTTWKAMVDPLRSLDKRYKGKAVPFGDAAKALSDDPSAKENGGDLGYFTSMQMVYPFESAAYNGKVGEVSMPVRTRYGFHLVKVLDKRPAQGEVRVAHIMVKTTPGGSVDDSLKAKQKIEEIYAKLKQGEKFEELAKQFSDDKPSAAKGGELPWFGRYKMPAEFENVSFALAENGDVSQPVKTRYGWHLVKRLERRGIGKYDDMKAELKTRISRDSRSQKGRESLIARIKEEYTFQEEILVIKGKKNTFPALEAFYTVIDTSIYKGVWTPNDKVKAMGEPLFRLGDKTYSQADFAKFIETHQARRAKTNDIASIVNAQYKQFVEETCVALEESNLDKKYPEFRALMQEYRDGILLFDLMDRKVWSKAVKDSAGLKNFYEKNKTKYMWDERSDAAVYSCASDSVAQVVRAMLKKKKTDKEILEAVNKNSQLNLQVESKLFNKGENELVDKNWKMKKGITENTMKDKKVVFMSKKKKVPPTNKTLQEAKGLVTADYQNQLEKEWVESLKKKCAVTVNKDVLDSIKKGN
ncbi:MAG: peptidyl-prolyl cis-trans isomerase SurA [Bacteroidetes bacterium]|nr:MAG: peptidyl-prolyl cis-trans isomerase SurA [Bacteroidota bacterium]